MGTSAVAKTAAVSVPAFTQEWRPTLNYFVSNQDVKESSRALYDRTLKLFFEWVAESGRKIGELTRKDILDYKEELFANGHSSLTVASYLTSIRKFYEWLEGEKIYPNIARGVKTPRRVQQFKKQHLTDEKSGELLTHFENISKRDYAIVNLILRTGLRTIEVVRADVGDITFKGDRRILKVWGKGHDTKDDFVVLTDKAYEPIRVYLADRKKAKANEPLFTSDSHRNTGERLTTRTISKLCKDGLRAIGLDDRTFTAHSLRHTAAVAILKNGGNLTDAQAV
ncbi:MAG: site-specific integrase, partial [Clostridia bacterium]|nr:site-specific integrase [Clostridia bacterium]